MKLTQRILLLPCVSGLLFLACSLGLLIWQYPQFQAHDAAGTIFQRLLWGQLAIGALLLLLTMLGAWRLAYRLSTEIMELATISREIAQGNLSEASTGIHHLEPHDAGEERPDAVDESQHLLYAITDMTDNLNSLVGQVQSSGVQVAAASSQLFATAKWQESTVAKQIGSMSDVRSSMEDVFRITTSLAESMHQVADMSQTTVKVANSGHADLTRMKDAMTRMERASSIISDRLEAINQKADAITTIVTTITKVSEQTNLLSLNAAIEAEKAGEYGRGFTVVAREIRRLADQTAFATLDITQMVQEMQAAVSTGVTEMDRFIADVRNNSKDVGNVSLHLSRVIEYVQALSPNFENVNEAMGYQADHVQNINHAIHDLREDMQETKSSLQETYAVIGQLNDAIVNLQEEISRFKVS